jgi:hypothetical protein
MLAQDTVRVRTKMRVLDLTLNELRKVPVRSSFPKNEEKTCLSPSLLHLTVATAVECAPNATA